MLLKYKPNDKKWDRKNLEWRHEKWEEIQGLGWRGWDLGTKEGTGEEALTIVGEGGESIYNTILWFLLKKLWNLSCGVLLFLLLTDQAYAKTSTWSSDVVWVPWSFALVSNTAQVLKKEISKIFLCQIEEYTNYCSLQNWMQWDELQAWGGGGGEIIPYKSDRADGRTFQGLKFVVWYRLGC